MLETLSLRMRINTVLVLLMAVTLSGAALTLWYTYRIQELWTETLDRHVAAYQVAEVIENALTSQKGYVTYFFLDGDPEWLKRLGEYRQIFKQKLEEAGRVDQDPGSREAIARIGKDYEDYVALKDMVIQLYTNGEKDRGAILHREARESFQKVLALTGAYKETHKAKIVEARRKSDQVANRLRLLTAFGASLASGLGVILAITLIKSILIPLRRLAAEADRRGERGDPQDEVVALRRSVRGLLQDVDHTHLELEKSRETLLHAEKLALVGKLAAGMAHSIRNPLTSVKMRLFSLGRNLDLSTPQRDDFKVISEEIRHIDTIVQNFLEFSRPPKLKMQEISPSDVVDLAVQLLKHRLEAYDVTVGLDRTRPLCPVQADPEQLKEVLINIMENSCEAMESGGTIRIREQQGDDALLGRVCAITLTDQGPGVPEALREKIFQPFFTTKEEGTGLGLSIAARIVAEHRGRLELVTEQGAGAVFRILLPIGG